MYVIVVNIILILWALYAFGQMRSNTQWTQTWLEKSLPDLKNYVWPSVGVGFLSSSFRVEFIKQSWLWRSQVWDRRRFLFSSAQTLLSFVWVFLIFCLFLEVNGYAVVAISIAALLVGQWQWLRQRSLGTLLPSFLYLAIALLFLELSFKNSTILMQFLMETEWVFFLTVDSAVNLGVLLFGSIAVGYLLSVQGWSLVVTFLLFLNSQISFMGFALVIIGELIGTTLYLCQTIWRWDEYYKNRIKGLMQWLLGYEVMAIVCVVVFRYFFSFGGSFNQLIDLKWIFLVTVFLVLSGFYLTVMIWGHFASMAHERDVVTSDMRLANDFMNADSGALLFYIKDQLRLRRDKLIEYHKELDADPESRKKIPPFVLTQFEREIKIIQNLV